MGVWWEGPLFAMAMINLLVPCRPWAQKSYFAKEEQSFFLEP
jgi:hypothetical protein